jgi:hypothetical protein
VVNRIGLPPIGSETLLSVVPFEARAHCSNPVNYYHFPTIRVGPTVETTVDELPFNRLT